MSEIYNPNITQPINWILIGYGNLGKSLVSAWIQRGLCNSDCMIVDRSSTPQEGFPGSYIQDLKYISKSIYPDVIILAVKPCQIVGILKSNLALFSDNSLLLSVMAGVSISTLKTIIGKNPKVIRAMPNLASEIMNGITGIWQEDTLSKKDKYIINSLLSALGRCIWLSNESKIDSITALTGSGPAYVFAFIEAMVSAGKKIGCDEFNESVVTDLILGSVRLLASRSTNATRMREAVTSVGGTTESALKILQGSKNHCNLELLITNAVSAGKDKSIQLTSLINKSLKEAN